MYSITSTYIQPAVHAGLLAWIISPPTHTIYRYVEKKTAIHGPTQRPFGNYLKRKHI